MKKFFYSALMLITFCSITSNLNAQTPEIIWTNRIPGLGDIFSISNILSTPDGGYIMGYTYNTVPFGVKFRMLFLDKFGDITSSFTYDSLGAFNEYILNNISQSFNGGFLLTGQIHDNLNQKNYTILVKLNSNGSVIWEKILTELPSTYHRGLKSIQTSEGFIVLSEGMNPSWNTPALPTHALLTRVDEDGNYLGSQIYSQDFPLYPYDMVKTWDNRIVFICKTGEIISVTLYKVELNLSVEWIVPLNIGYLRITPNCLMSSIEGGFLIGGYGNYGNPFNNVGALVKTYSNGLVIDYETYGDSSTNTAFQIYSIIEQSDGSVLSTGNLWKNYVDNNMMVLKTNAQLDTVYSKILAEDMIGYSINKCKDGNIIVAGSTQYYPDPDTIYLVKIKSDIPSYSLGNEGLGIPIGDYQIVSNTIYYTPLNKKENQLSSILIGVDVMLDSITHTSTGDLEFTLSHNGVVDTLVFHAGGEGNDFLYTILSDQAQNPVNFSLPPFIGDYKPYSPLTKFSGMDATGEWTLSILDNVTGNTGMLHAWGLRFYFEGPVGVDDKTQGIVSEYKLFQNYPNPFNPSTMISYQLPVGGNVTLKVYDLLGREVATLVDEYKPVGKYEVEFQSTLGSQQLASGIYFYQLKIFDPESGSGQIFVQTKKMILLK